MIKIDYSCLHWWHNQIVNLCFLFPTATTTRVIQCSFCSKMEWTVGTTFTCPLWLWNGKLLQWGLPRGFGDRRHCSKMWRQSFSNSPTADKSWKKKGDNLRQRRCCKAVRFLCDLTKIINHSTVVAQPVSCFPVLALRFCSTVAPRYNEVSWYGKKCLL